MFSSPFNNYTSILRICQHLCIDVCKPVFCIFVVYWKWLILTRIRVLRSLLQQLAIITLSHIQQLFNGRLGKQFRHKYEGQMGLRRDYTHSLSRPSLHCSHKQHDPESLDTAKYLFSQWFNPPITRLTRFNRQNTWLRANKSYFRLVFVFVFLFFLIYDPDLHVSFTVFVIIFLCVFF